MQEQWKLAEQIRTCRVQPERIVVWGLGQMGVCIKDAQQQVIFLDPILTNVVAETFPEMSSFFTRAFPAPLIPEEIDFADYIFCTHEHLDHADPWTLKGILQASPRAVCYTSDWARESLIQAGLDSNRIQPVKPGKFLEKTGLKVYAIPSAHYEVEIDPDRGSRWLGFLLDWNGLRFYHSGDTILYPGFVETLQGHAPIQGMMLALNGRDEQREALGVVGNLNLQEAQLLAAACQTQTVLVGHNDLFTANSVPLADQNENQSVVAWVQLNPGQEYVFGQV